MQTNSLQNNGGYHGTQASFPASSMPLLPLVATEFHGGADVSVASGNTTTLNPGTYGNLHVSGTAYLNPGSYWFTGITLDAQASLFASSGAVTVNVNNQLLTGGGSLLQGQLASDLTIVVDGSDVSGSTPSAATFGTGSQVTALVSAPHGTISIGDQTVATGAFVGFDVAVGQFCNVSFVSRPRATSAGALRPEPLRGGDESSGNVQRESARAGDGIGNASGSPT